MFRVVIILLMLYFGPLFRAQTIILPADDTVCVGESSQFSASTTCTGSVIFTWWLNGDSVLTNSTGLFITLATQNTNQIEVICSCTVNGITSFDSAQTILTVIIPNISAGPDQFVDSGTLVTLEAIGNFDSLFWSPSYLVNSPESALVETVPSQTTTYMLHAYYLGCEVFDYVTVFLTDVFKIPNTFSPNNDGTNDSWIIPGIENYPNNRMLIMNRFGDVLYEASSYSTMNAWSGIKNGNVLPDGVYYYLLDLGNGNIKKGTISIIR